ncbi:MAG TPA: hypothetical protein VFD42_01800 [Chloroflexota bacterium]|nr:hypothetical protein [Chloroflexota bacterium]
MLRRVAAQLAHRSWDGALSVKPEFVVYAANYEMGDVPEAIAASNPADRVAALKEKGWL